VLVTGVPNPVPLLGGACLSGTCFCSREKRVPEGRPWRSRSLSTWRHRGKAACFLTSASEPASRLLERARSHAFFDTSATGRHISHISVYPLIHHGLQGVREALEQHFTRRLG